MSPNRSQSQSHSVIQKELSRIEAADIMVPRSSVILINSSQSFSEIVDIIMADGHSRFPVYNGQIDNITGVLYAKDLLQFFKQIDVNFDIGRILRKALFVSENKKASELLTEFRDSRVHLAIVVDEYGTMLGIITLEDIIERIIGEINDEFDTDEQNDSVQALSKDEFIISAKMTLEEFNNLFKTRIFSEDYDTIAGYLIQSFGYVPKTGESMEISGQTVTVKASEGSRLKKLLVKKL